MTMQELENMFNNFKVWVKVVEDNVLYVYDNKTKIDFPWTLGNLLRKCEKAGVRISYASNRA